MGLVALAMPIAYASGSSFVQLAVAAAAWAPVAVADSLGERRAARWLPLASALLVVVVLVLMIIEPAGLKAWVSATLLCGWAGLAAWLGSHFARRHRPQQAGVVSMVEQLVSNSLWLGLGLSIWYPITLAFGDRLPSNLISYSVAATGCLVLAWRAARAGQVATATVLPAVAVSILGVGLTMQWKGLGLVLYQREMSIVAGLVLIGWGARELLQRRADLRFWTLLTIGLLVCVLMPWRELIAEPIPALLGLSAVAVLFTGLLWRFLTEADWANNAWTRAPRAARVLIFCAYALIAGTARCCSPMAMAVAATSIWTATPRSAAMSSGRRCRWRWWWASSRGQVSTVPNSPARRAASGW